MSKKKRGASRARRSRELVHAASLLQENQPDLASGLTQQVRALQDRSGWPADVTSDLPSLYGDKRAAGRDELVEAGKALLRSHPTTANRLLRQAASLTTSHKLRSRILELAAKANRQAEMTRAIARKAAQRARAMQASTTPRIDCGQDGQRLRDAPAARSNGIPSAT